MATGRGLEREEVRQGAMTPKEIEEGTTFERETM
jgi:hypothetical protein